MTRAELLGALIRQARSNGFEFRKWYTTRVALPWSSFAESVQTLSEGRRYYALLFAHEFAQSFWRSGSKMAFVVPTNTFTRISKDGTIKVVQRKGHIRRSVIPDAWRYHMKEMAVADDPLRYIRKFLLIEEDLAGVQAVSDEEDGDAAIFDPRHAGTSKEPGIDDNDNDAIGGMEENFNIGK
ncbi:MAG: hypothetical protein ACYCPM_04985 [Acidobacteriaceae bacterium]|jgi:hypothetical protein